MTSLPQVRVLPSGLPALAAAALAVAAAGLWIVAHRLGRRQTAPGALAGLAALRLLLGALALLTAMEAIGRWLALATNWPLWTLALGGAAAVEALLALYRLERRTVPPRPGSALTAMRVALGLLVIGMLAQPVLRAEQAREVRRSVAVLLDTSASMRVADDRLPPSARLRLAASLRPEAVPRPRRLEATAEELTAVRKDLEAEREWLAMLDELDRDARLRHVRSREGELREALKEARRRVAGITSGPAEPHEEAIPIPDELASELAGLTEDLAARVEVPLRAAVDAGIAGGPEPAAGLRAALDDAAAGLDALLPRMWTLAARLDEAYHAALPPEQRAVVEEVGGATRLELARQVLAGGPGGEGLLGRLRQDYALRTYAVAAGVEETPLDADTGLRPGGADAPGTDLAAALDRAMSDVPADRLAGVVLLTDGRHNAPAPVGPVARRLARERLPVCTVVFGDQAPPTDAAVAAVEAPETIYAGDSLYATAELKLDGMEGSTAKVMLLRADTVVHVQEVDVGGRAVRARVELTDTPPGAGLLTYGVRVDGPPAEAFSENNEYRFAVNVSDEQVRLLLVEGRPRWEYRYLKNLFSGRDRTVRLQHVLFRPERIAGVEQPPTVHASAVRPAGESEATALPRDEEDWLRFDAVIVGDLSPEDLPPPAQHALRRFVVDRAGTLIAIAGPGAMPHAFAGSPLGELLPVFPASGGAPVPEEGFRIALTPEGAESVVMRLIGEPAENSAFWSERPPVRWRCALAGVKPGATVLAYAEPGSEPDEPRDRAFQQENALVVVQNVGLGRVLFLAFDRTWRLRYREGDAYHHKFWGQVLRWATGTKLPSGTALARLGTDRARYAMGSPVEARARILRPDLSPLVGGEAAVALYAGGRLVMRRKLDYIADQPGVYAADLGKLAPGAYRLELQGPDAPTADDGAPVSAEFSVDPATSTERIELAADYALARGLAEQTGGVAVGPADAMRVSEALRPALLSLRDRRDYAVWDSWPLLTAMVALAAAEWLLRRKVGLP
jgi:hypothetical protein